jgi:hypothetical protein
MDSFTLGFLPKIDFNDEHNNSTTATAWKQTNQHNNYKIILSKL